MNDLWLSILPVIAIITTVLAVTLTADGAPDVLDPKLKRGLFRRIRQRSARPASSRAPERAGIPAAPPRTHATDATDALLDVRELRVEFPFDDRVVRAVRGASFTVRRGESIGIVGESGSGKTVTWL